MAWLVLPREGFYDVILATTKLLPHLQMLQSYEPAKKTLLPDLIYPTDHWRQVRLARSYRSCRWFSRTWVIQEILLAHNVRVFCGTQEIHLQNVLDLTGLLFSFTWAEIVATDIVSPAPGASFPWLLEIRQSRSLSMLGVGNEGNPRANSSYEGPWEEDNSGFVWWLAAVLNLSRIFLCQDPRDSVYLVLGIVGRPRYKTRITSS